MLINSWKFGLLSSAKLFRKKHQVDANKIYTDTRTRTEIFETICSGELAKRVLLFVRGMAEVSITLLSRGREGEWEWEWQQRSSSPDILVA